MPEPFTHLRVCSGASMRHGTDSPAALVARAAELGMDALALTDRDGLYGAIKHVSACVDAGLAPILGVDLAVETPEPGAGPNGRQGAGPNGGPRRRTPARGGSIVDPGRARITVLAHSGGRQPHGDGVLPDGAGYAALCHLVSATHLRGERGAPVTTPALVAEHCVHAASGAAALTVVLGPASDVGRALLSRRTDLARALLARWYDALPLGALALEVVCHLGAPGTPASLAHAAHALALAKEVGLPAVLTNAVRHLDPAGAPVADVLDASRRLVPLDLRQVDRTSAQGYLKGSSAMTAIAHQVARAAGEPSGGALLAGTAALARRTRLDPGRDLGLGSVHLPEPAALGLASGADADAVLRAACEGGVGRRYPGASETRARDVRRRLAEELAVIAELGYARYFLTVSQVCEMTRALGVRVAARGSGAGSLVNHLLGVSGVEPLGQRLLMERFLTTARAQLPDIDLDVESARRTEVYEAIIGRFGGERVAAVSMMDTYRVRHALRDTGAALGMLPSEIDAIAKAFPHIRARNVRDALADLPELRASGLGSDRLSLLYDLVERLDGLPRHIALHPCGVLLSDTTLLDRTPVEASWLGFPMSQYDKDDVETLGLLKLDVLGIRMQSAMAYATQEVQRTEGVTLDVDKIPLDDEDTFRLVRSTRTLGCFQIESPGQRELVGKFAPQDFSDLVIDISLFRPGPVKSDMVTPFLAARQGWTAPDLLHERLRGALAETEGVVVFHEQVLRIVAETAGVSLTQADEVRRAMGSPAGQEEVEAWWRPLADGNGFAPADVDRIWEVLKAFASFGFCKAHAAAFALPTYQSAWFKTHHPAAFLAGVLTHDPGMYPKRLILDDARNLGITVLGLDVNASRDTYRVERVEGPDGRSAHGGRPPGAIAHQPVLAGRGAVVAREGYRVDAAVPDARGWGIRLSLADVKGITEAEVAAIVAGQPYASLGDLAARARPSRPVLEHLVMTGALDAVHGIVDPPPGVPAPRGGLTRRDLLLQVAALERWSRAASRGARRRPARSAGPRPTMGPGVGSAAGSGPGLGSAIGAIGAGGTASAAARQSRAPAPVVAAGHRDVQMSLDLGDEPTVAVSGLPEMTSGERVRAELEILGLDASRHVLDAYAPLLAALGVTRGRDLSGRRSASEVLIAGVKVATQTPPIRSGRRVVFLTLDDAAGPVDATFFEDVQGPYASTVFGSWLLLVRGELRRTGPRGVSVRATGAWDLPRLWQVWRARGLDGVLALLRDPAGETSGWDRAGRAGAGAAASRSPRPVVAAPPLDPAALLEPAAFFAPAAFLDLEPAPAGVVGVGRDDGAVPGIDAGRSGGDERGANAARRAAAARAEQEQGRRGGGMGGSPTHRKVLLHSSGFRQSPYTDIGTAGGDVRNTRAMAGGEPAATTEGTDATEEAKDVDPSVDPGAGPGRKLWHSSQNSSGR